VRNEDSRAVIRIKTRELERQFETLTQRLSLLREELAAAADRGEKERFSILHRGLSATGIGVFEDASFADGIAEEIRCGSASEEMIRSAVQRLDREREKLSRRAAAAILYGRLFEEADSKEVETTLHLTGASGARKDAISALLAYWTDAPPIVDTDALRTLLREECSSTTTTTSDAGANVESVAAAFFAQAVSANEIRAHLHVLAHSFDHRVELRSYARRLLGDESAINDLAGALTILVRQPNTWDWNEWLSSTRINVRWNRTRWRAFLDADLVPQLLLEAVALRLGVWARSSWLPRTLGPRGRKWDTFDHVRHALASALVLPGIGTTIQAYEQQAPNAYAGAGSITGEADYFQQLFALVNADLWWHRQIGAEELYVAQSDLEDFFPALPHATITTLLEVMHVPKTVIDFIAGYLHGPYRFEADEVITPQRGMFPGNTLSRVIGDALCIALDAYVERKSRTYLTRFMDDLFWVTTSSETLENAWNAIDEFCRVAGLRTNRAKTTAQRIGNEAFESSLLPTKTPLRWGFLALDPVSCTWIPHGPSIEEFRTTLHERLNVEGVPARQVAREYNAALGYFVRGLAPLTALDVAHLDRLHSPLQSVHADLGIVDVVLRARLKERADHPMLRDLVGMLPAGWFYWPVTAGGLGLYNPASMLAGARRTLAQWQRSNQVAPAKLESDKDPRADSQWCTAYQVRASASLRLAPPTPSPEMAGRQRDFIARGSEMRGAVAAAIYSLQQPGLHPYWQWLLETHGPSLVDMFGTLRFLPTEVVPVDPIAGAPAPQSLLSTTHASSSSDDDIPF
jgi:hypothetical protein